MTAAITRAAVVVALALALPLTGGAVAHAPAPVQVVEEDDPRWDCATMGNRQCGTPSAVAA